MAVIEMILSSLVSLFIYRFYLIEKELKRLDASLSDIQSKQDKIIAILNIRAKNT